MVELSFHREIRTGARALVPQRKWRFSTRAKWRYFKTQSAAEFVYLDNAVVVIDGMTLEGRDR